MTTWRRARKGERCGFCLDLVFKGGEPIMLYGSAGLTRCASCAKHRYGADVPDPFPDPLPEAFPQIRRPEFVSSTRLVADYRRQQTGERP